MFRKEGRLPEALMIGQGAERWLKCPLILTDNLKVSDKCKELSICYIHSYKDF